MQLSELVLEVCKQTTFHMNFMFLIANLSNIINLNQLQDDDQPGPIMKHLASLEGRIFKAEILVQGSETEDGSNLFILSRIWNAEKGTNENYS